MKKERNCGCEGNYPIYSPYQPNFPGMMPQGMMGMPQMQPMMDNQSYNFPTGNYSNTEQQLASINNKLNSLERRINNLENLVGNSTKYNNSNYQVM